MFIGEVIDRVKCYIQVIQYESRILVIQFYNAEVFNNLQKSSSTKVISPNTFWSEFTRVVGREIGLIKRGNTFENFNWKMEV